MKKRIFFSVFFALLLALFLVWTTSGIAAETSGTSKLVGKWKGTWDGGLKAELIIEQIKGDKADVIYRWGNLPKRNISAGESYISANLITSHNRPIGIEWNKHGPSFKFVMYGDKLEGTRVAGKHYSAIEMTKVPSAPSESLVGKWKGRWGSATGLKAELVIEQIKGDKAQVVYRWGNLPKYNISAGEAHISANLITSHNRPIGIEWSGHGRSFKFLMYGDKLEGIRVSRKYHNVIEMTKVP